MLRTVTTRSVERKSDGDQNLCDTGYQQAEGGQRENLSHKLMSPSYQEQSLSYMEMFKE